MKSLAQVLDELGLNPQTLNDDKIYLSLRSMFSYSSERPRKPCKGVVIYKKLGREVTFTGQELSESDYRVLVAIYNAPKDYGRVSLKSLLELLNLENTRDNRTAVTDSIVRLKNVLLGVNWYFENTETFRRPYRNIVLYLLRAANFGVGDDSILIYVDLDPRIKISEHANYEGLILRIK